MGLGTTVTVSLPLPQSGEIDEEEANFGSNIRELAGRRALVRGFERGPPARGGFHPSGGIEPQSQLRLMEAICREWLHMEVIPASDSGKSSHPDFVIFSGENLSDVDVEKLSDLAVCPHIFICQDSVVAHGLCKPKQSRSRTDFEFTSQPVGPRKLAETLFNSRCRWKEAQSSLPASASPGSLATDEAGPTNPPLYRGVTVDTQTVVEKLENVNPETHTDSGVLIAHTIAHKADHEMNEGCTNTSTNRTDSTNSILPQPVSQTLSQQNKNNKNIICPAQQFSEAQASVK